jgi:hypothetical protein
MDPRSINFAARRNLGFFLTKGKDTDSNREEHEFFAGISRKCTDILRERRIRPANVLSELEKTNAVIDEIATLVSKDAYRLGYEDLQTHAASRAYASFVVTASLSRYANLMERRNADKTRPKQND